MILIPIIHHMKAIARNFATGKYMGALIRPMGSTTEMFQDKKTEQIKAILDAFYQVVKEAGTQKAISRELQTAVATPLINTGGDKTGQ